MSRLLLSVLLLFASAAVAAEGQEGAAQPAPTCTRSADQHAETEAAASGAAAPAKAQTPAAKPRAGAATRSVTPRWNSLLPGMFR